MEEKKLTDDTEIDVGMIEEATEAVKNNQNAGCYVGDLLRIIHRLQSENKRLNDIEFTQEHCDLYSENEWLKAELKRECEEHEEFTKKAKEEIERLTEEKKTLVWLNQSLKNQVDELKEFKNQVTLFGLYGAGLENGRKQGAKETAKVLTLIRNGVSLNSMIDEDAKIAIMNELRWVGQKFGVEVE